MNQNQKKKIKKKIKNKINSTKIKIIKTIIIINYIY